MSVNEPLKSDDDEFSQISFYSAPATPVEDSSPRPDPSTNRKLSSRARITALFTIFALALVVCLVIKLPSHVIGYIAGSMELLCGAYVVLSILQIKSPSSTTYLLLFRTIADSGIAARFMVSPLVNQRLCDHSNCDLDDLTDSDEHRCDIPGAILEFFEIASECWLLCMAIDQAIILQNPFAPFHKRIVGYHFFSWGTALVSALLLYSMPDVPGFWIFNPNTNVYSICWFKSDSPRGDFQPYVFLYLPLLIIYSYTIYVLVRLSFIMTDGKIQITFSHRIRTVEATKNMLNIFTIFNICAVTLGILTHVKPSFWVPFKFITTSKGFLCLVVFWMTEDSEASDETTPRKNSEKVIDLHSLLQKAVVLAASHGIGSTAEAGIRLNSNPRCRMSSADSSQSSRNEINSMNFTANVPTLGDQGIEQLRRGSIPEDLEQLVKSKDVDTTSNPVYRPPSVRRTGGEVASSNLGTEMIDPVSETKKSEPDKRSRKTSVGEMTISEPQQHRSRKHILDVLSIPLMIHFTTGIQFVEYCPTIFREIRKELRVEEIYARAFEGNLESRVMEGGASNAIYFFSECKRFVVKSCTEEEMTQIRNNVEMLKNHFIDHPNTFIMKIFGAYKIQMYTCNLYFMVCNNIFYTQKNEIISEKYDLKGSSVNRFMKSPQVGQRVRCKGCQRVFIYSTKSQSEITDCPLFHHQPDFILKDNDMRGRNKFRFSPEVADDIIRRLKVDISFLCTEYKTMDYSFLVGLVQKIQTLSDGTPAKPKDEIGNSRLQAQESIVNYAYYLGIIDYQQPYTTRKQIENWVKVNLLREPKEELSCIDPVSYGNRFLEFMENLLYDSNVPRRQTDQEDPFLEEKNEKEGKERRR